MLPETPPCQSRKVSSGSVMEKRAAKYSWEGGSKKVAIWILWKMILCKKYWLLWVGLARECDAGDLCCATKNFGHALYPEVVVGSEWLEAQSLGVHSSLPAFRQVTPPFHLSWKKDQRDKKGTTIFQLGVPHPSHFKVSILFLLSMVQDSKLCCKTTIPGWMSNE